MNPFLIIAAELDADEEQAVAATKTPKTVVAANDDRYSKTYYGDKAANE